MMNREQARQIAELINSRNQHVVRYDADEVLKSAGNYIYNFDNNGNVAGCVKVEWIQWYQWEISHLSVAIGHEGKGLGTDLVWRAADKAKKGHAQIIQCVIRDDNKASKAVFSKCGFKQVSIFYHPSSRANLTVWQNVVSLPLKQVIEKTEADDALSWQQQPLEGELLEKQLAYWKEHLAGELPVLELARDYARPTGQTFNSGTLSLKLSEELSAGLSVLSRQEEATLFMTSLAAFKTLLYRYTGQEDIIVGTPIAGRNHAELEGPIINTLVLRSDLSGMPTFSELLGRVRQVTLDAYAHQDVPFEKLVLKLQPERDLSRSPLFQVWVNMPNLRGSSREQAKCDLSLYISDGQEIGLRLVYNADLFSEKRMSHLLEQFHYLLEQVVANPTHPLSFYSLLTPSQENILPNPNAVLPQPEQQPITNLITYWAKHSPQQSAIECEERTFTYHELLENAQTIAQRLLAHGLERGEVVGVYGPRSFELVSSLVGVLLSGGVFLTLDPNLPAQRLLLMQQQAQAKFLLHLGQENSLNWLEERPECQIIDLSAKYHRYDAPVVPLPTISPEDAAYIFFTSGTTGVPKGVLGCHKGLAHFLSWQRQTFEVGPSDRSGQLTALSFDVVLRDIFLSLTSGATLVLPTSAYQVATPQILSWLEEKQITLLHTVPSLAKSWLAEVPSGVSLQTLRCLFFAGEPLTKQLIDRWRQAFRHSGALINLYGPTETTMAKFYYRIPTAPLPGVQPVGYPLPQTQALVLNNNQQCGIGEAGEIVIRTPFRTLGYINGINERFVKSPFSGDDQDLLYYTGDLGRYRPDGVLEILGRKDHQIKIRGMRIELQEIESVLNNHPAVRESVVIAHESEGDKRLVAYVVGSESTNSRELRHFLTRSLPNYMVPTAFMRLEAVPLTPNGKINRRALPEPVWSDGQKEVAAPRTPTEELLTLIWSEVLNVPQVGIHDNLFELGGHSLLAVQIISRVRQTFGVELPLRRLFESPTVAQLSKQIESTKEARLPAIELVPRSGELPLSFAQQRLWFLEQLEGPSATYNIFQTRRITGPLNVTYLSRSLSELVRRHESLRTTFTFANGQAKQVIHPALNISLPVVELAELTEEEREATVRRLSRQQAEEPFDLEGDSLLRVKLLKLGREEHLLLVVIHHIVSDAWSGRIFMRELFTLYEAYQENKASPLPPLKIQYADFAHWQQQQLNKELDQQLAYWKEHLAGELPILELPRDYVRPTQHSFKGGTLSLTLSEELSEGLSLLRRREGVTLFMTLLASFKTLLYRYTGQEDMIVGTPIAGRNRAELEGQIGFFINTLVLRSDLSANPTFSELLDRVRQVALDAYAHQDVPFEKLVEELQPERDLSRTPIFQAWVNMPNLTEESTEQVAGLTVETSDLGERQAKFDLSLYISGRQQITLKLVYNADLFSETRIQRMATHFQTLLEGIVANPDQPIANLPLLTEAERDQLLVEWNNRATDYPRNQCIHQLFEQQVKRTPEATAVVAGSQQLTYRELNARANQLAHLLIAQGVGPDMLVGICVERSVEMIVGLLGILKAGGAYLPLDPSLPLERSRFMIEDAQVEIILTDQQLVDAVPQVAQIICLDTDWSCKIAGQPRQNPLCMMTPENLVYVIFTSGSTGRPKGVMVEHRQLLNYVVGIQEALDLPLGASFATVSTLAADLGNTAIFPTLCTGGKLLVMSQAELSDPILFADAAQRYGMDCLKITPSHLAALMSGPCPAAVLPRQRLVLGGEASSWKQIQKIHSLAPTCRIVNHYGPTETTIGVLTYSIKQDTTGLMTVPIGRPIANNQTYILDRYGQPVPTGVPGELYIGGPQVARGYKGRPQLTAEKFIPNPFGTPAWGSKLYKTGDLCRYLPDTQGAGSGSIEFLGRADHQVKIRGFRVELGEIESVLASQPNVRKAVVVVVDKPSGVGKRLVAYVVPIGHDIIEDGVAGEIERLRAAITLKLPHYMIPSAFVALEAMPLTPNGKIDRRALPTPEFGADASQLLLPRTPTEEILAAVWQEVLELERVGIHDNFFELGGHSLLAVQLISRMRQTFGVELPLRRLFEFPTVAQLSQEIEREDFPQQGKSSFTSLVPIQQHSDHPPFFCVPGVGGSVTYLYELARSLGKKQPFYALQAIGLDGESNPYTTIEEMAAHYISNIMTVQPKGPYFLGGHSFGGQVAFEMAQQLMRRGHEVALLALLDSSAPRMSQKAVLPWDETRWLLALIAHIEHSSAQMLEISYDELHSLTPEEQLAYLSKRMIQVNLLPPEAGTTLVRGLLHVFKANRQIHYVPQEVIPTRMTLFRANGKQDDLGWGKFGPVDLNEVPGTHHTMMEPPHVQVLASQLRAILGMANGQKTQLFGLM